MCCFHTSHPLETPILHPWRWATKSSLTGAVRAMAPYVNDASQSNASCDLAGEAEGPFLAFECIGSIYVKKGVLILIWWWTPPSHDLKKFPSLSAQWRSFGEYANNRTWNLEYFLEPSASQVCLQPNWSLGRGLRCQSLRGQRPEMWKSGGSKDLQRHWKEPRKRLNRWNHW